MVENLATTACTFLVDRYGIADPTLRWDRPASAEHGDLATPIALKIAKQINKKPGDIAAELAAHLTEQTGVERAEVAGPGYVNVWLTTEALLTQLDSSMAAWSPQPLRTDEAPVIIEYSAPNIAKPLGAHHIIGTVLGQVVSNLYAHAGYPVVRWNYIGDWGTQFGKLAVALERWGDTKPAECTLEDLLGLYVRFHEEAETDAGLEEAARAASLRLEQGDETMLSFWHDVVAVTKRELHRIYDRLHVTFDVEIGESFYRDATEAVLQEGKDAGVFVPGEKGSFIVEFPDDAYPPYLVQRGDGGTLYSTRDLAQMRYRIETYHPQRILIFTDIAQKLHFEQLVATCKQLQWDLPPFEHVLFGRMRFVDGSMSTRKGNVLKLEHVLDEAVSRAAEVIRSHGERIQSDDPVALADMMGIGSVVYGILSQNRKQELVFDWDRMLAFEGNSAPYLQYTHARARSVLRKAAAEGFADPVHASVAVSPADRQVLQMLLQAPDVLHQAREEHLPHVLSTYLYTLCQQFNAWYNAEPILKAEPDVRALRLQLTHSVAEALRSGAQLLTLRVPDFM